MLRTFALFLILTACTAQPAAPPQADACKLTSADALASYKAHHRRTVPLDAVALDRAKKQLKEFDSEGDVLSADGGFFVYLEDVTALILSAHDCAISALAPFTREEIAEIMGVES